MSPESSTPSPTAFLGLSPADFDALAADWGWPAFRGPQVRQWVYEKLQADAQGMSNLSQSDRRLLSERVEFARADVTQRQISSDGTIKLLLTWPDKAVAETVMIPDAARRTACVSSQVGCPVGCRFCASGIGGVRGNLSAAQIVEQIFQMNLLLRQRGERITHVVFMGMGEPLANYAQVMKAVRILHDPQCFNISARRITISTVGVPSRMRQLAGENLPLNLAVSLHAPDEKLRRELIPWAEHFALEEILAAAREYFEKTGREITLEYILLAGVNDRQQQAWQLARLCRTLRANLNLIRYNPVESLPFKRPASIDVMNFQNILRSAGINAHVRRSRGRDIDAACGQLRRRQENSAPSPTPAVRPAFTLIELIVLSSVLVILFSIFIPYVLVLGESARRVRCAENLRSIRQALGTYASDHDQSFPRVRYDRVNNPNGYTAFIGPDSANPFAADSDVPPNDVTASLWLLVRNGLIKDTSVFICPSTDDSPDPMTDAHGRPVGPTQRGNFRLASNLSYSYASPFSATPGYAKNDMEPAYFDIQPWNFAVLSDKNPGVWGDLHHPAGPAQNALPPQLAEGNSPNHAHAGQNVLYADGHVEFSSTPYCGVGQDNIYTALSPVPLEPHHNPPADGRGFWESRIGPAWPADSYLVPTAAEGPR